MPASNPPSRCRGSEVKAISPRETIDITTSARPAQALVTTTNGCAPGVSVIYARDWFLKDEALATAARALFDQGRIDLVQRRIRTGWSNKFACIAIKRKSLSTAV